MCSFTPVDRQEPLLEIDVLGDAERCDVQLRGEVDADSAEQLRAALRGCAAAGSRLVVIDLAAVGLLAAAGLTVLLEAHHELRAAGNWLVLCHADRLTVRILAISGLDAVFAVVGSDHTLRR